MEHPAAWNPLKEWKHTDVDWVRVDISQEDMRRFTQRSNLKGLCHALGFLMLVAATGTWAYWAFSQGHWVLMVAALYFHGMTSISATPFTNWDITRFSPTVN